MEVPYQNNFLEKKVVSADSEKLFCKVLKDTLTSRGALFAGWGKDSISPETVTAWFPDYL
ncbi:hypothetical protein JYU06_00745 [Desulfotalea psychrophila]|uniref:Uncharacterized protein n=1 Tax=Desulfotalea psychrophila TaxID=84980 RepID=A0ABS3AU36_9BACT|nr:hypothetical protein [Desulfotalea psychrophila]